MKDYLDHHFEGVGHNSPQYIHLVAEIEKRVFADRAEYLGDPDYVDVPIDELISEQYIAARALEVDPRISRRWRPRRRDWSPRTPHIIPSSTWTATPSPIPIRSTAPSATASSSKVPDSC